MNVAVFEAQEPRCERVPHAWVHVPGEAPGDTGQAEGFCVGHSPAAQFEEAAGALSVSSKRDDSSEDGFTTR